MNVELNKRQKQYAYYEITRNLNIIECRVQQVKNKIVETITNGHEINESTIKVVKLDFTPIVNSWEFMSLFPQPLFSKIMELKTNIDNHNYDMDCSYASLDKKYCDDTVQPRLNKIVDITQDINNCLIDLINKNNIAICFHNF